MTELQSTVPPGDQITAEVNAVPAGHQALYTRTGTRLIVAQADVPQVMHDLGLITVQYDLEEATAELLSRTQAIAETIAHTAAEVTVNGYIDELLIGVVNTAVGEWRNTFDHWGNCVGALRPSEALVRDVAVHKAMRGDVSAIPGLARLEPVADAYAAAHDITDAVQAETVREAAEIARRGA